MYEDENETVRGKELLTAIEVTVATLSSENETAPNNSVSEDCSRAQPPYDGVTEQVDLAVILDPEILRKLVQYCRVVGR